MATARRREVRQREEGVWLSDAAGTVNSSHRAEENGVKKMVRGQILKGLGKGFGLVWERGTTREFKHKGNVIRNGILKNYPGSHGTCQGWTREKCHRGNKTLQDIITCVQEELVQEELVQDLN